MATVLDDRGGESGGPKKRRRRSAKRAAAELIQAVEQDLAKQAAAPSAAGAPDSTAVAQDGVIAESAVVVAAAPDGAAAALAEPEPAPAPAVLLPATEATDDQFADLLGQAVGVRLDAVSREFGGRNEGHVTALRDVSIEVGPCEFVAVMGPSGCGKTTLLSLMGGLDRPSAGHVYSAGFALSELSERDLADYRLQRVSTVFQTFNLIASMTVEDNVALPMTLAGVEVDERGRRARHLLELVGLENRAHVRAGRLSGGEQQKVAVARALANRPGLILADEPTGSLDTAAGDVVLKLLEDLNRRGATVVLVTHDPEVARRAHRVVRMIDGHAVELDAGRPTVRNQEPVTPAHRLHWRDTLKVGLLGAVRRPLRTSLTTVGVAIGIAAMSLIVALATGMQQALDSPALLNSQVHQVAVYPPADSKVAALDAGTLTTLSSTPHVRASWGQVAMSGLFIPLTPRQSPAGALVSLPPLGVSAGVLNVMAGRMPRSDTVPEVLLTDNEAAALGFATPASAIGQPVYFSATNSSLVVPGVAGNQVVHAVPVQLIVSGVVSSHDMPAGAAGGMAPYGLARSYWSQVAQANGWRGGEFSSISLLADSAPAVDSVRARVEALGFQTKTFGDAFRSFEDLLSKLKVALLGLALVALMLACLGIANTMYTAVLERTKEIGVLKALGARAHDILLLFVAESALIGLAGGLAGALVAVALARLGNSAVNRLAHATGGAGIDVFRADLTVVAAALVLAVALSMVSGLLPALRAAREDPARALRYE